MHHANLLIGSTIDSFDTLSGYRTPGPDVHHVIRDTLSIADVRTLALRAIERPLVATETIFIIVARVINHEAQNALLKLLEDPPSFVRIYLVVPQAGQLLPTVRSRLMLLESTERTASEAADFLEFKDASYAERLATIANKTKSKDVSWIEAVMRGADAYAHAVTTTAPAAAGAISAVTRRRGSRGASLKMLLEELALTLNVTS